MQKIGQNGDGNSAVAIPDGKSRKKKNEYMFISDRKNRYNSPTSVHKIISSYEENI